MVKEYTNGMDTIVRFAPILNVIVLTLLAVFNYRVANNKETVHKDVELEALRQKVDMILDNHLQHIEHRLEKLEETVQDIWKYVSTRQS